MANEISNSDDIIDSRDVIARIAELQQEVEYRLEELLKEKQAPMQERLDGLLGQLQYHYKQYEAYCEADFQVYAHLKHEQCPTMLAFDEWMKTGGVTREEYEQALESSDSEGHKDFDEWVELMSDQMSKQGVTRMATEYLKLSAELEDMEAESADMDSASAVRELSIRDEDEVSELIKLLELQDECEGYCSDWKYGASLIRNSYFQDYAQELAEDCGMVQKDLTWPNDHIDWESAAEALKVDYTEVDFDGVDYQIR